MNIPETLGAQTIAPEHYWAMMEDVSSGMFYWRVQKDHVLWSPKLRQTLGYSARQSAGLSDTYALMHPDDVDSNKRFLEEAMADQRDYTASVRLRDARDEYQQFDVSAHWVPTEHDGLPDLVGFLRDVTALNASRKQAARTERIFHALCENIPAAVHIAGADGTYIYGNEMAAKFAGCSRDAFVGRTPADLFDPEKAATLKQVDDRLLKSGGSNSRHDTFVTESGETRSILGTTFLIEGLSDAERLIAGVALDTTPQYEAEQSLARSQRLEALGKLVGGIAHDFNNTLAVLKGNLELLQIVDDVSECKIFYQEMSDAIERGRRLTLQLLAYGRKSVLSPKLHSLADIVADSQQMLRRVLPETIEIEGVSGGGLWRTLIDRSQVENVILNLAINARDSMPDGGKLTLETRNLLLDADPFVDRNASLEPGRYVMLAVTDTGTGMTREVMDRVFEPFYTTKSVDQGAGMGLAMVHGLMSQIGGSVRVHSELGIGTTVRLYFNAAEDAAQFETAQTQNRTGPGNAHILLAEDEESVRDMLTRQLKSLGYQVTAAINGDRAYDLLMQDASVDILITDVVMPGNLQGPMLARQARQHRPDLPVLFLSGYPRDAPNHGTGFKERDLSLMKPVEMQDLAAAVARLVKVGQSPG